MTEPLWYLTKDGDASCMELYERHYSDYRGKRRKVALMLGPGEKLVLRTADGRAVFAWRRYLDDTIPRQHGVECAIFRNEGPYQSSTLIGQADAVANHCWPGQRHYTKVDPQAVRSTNPGYCFIAAGWRRCGTTRGGLIVLEWLPPVGSNHQPSPSKDDASTN